MRVWLREPAAEKKATNMGHRRDRSKERGRVGTFPDPIESRMSWQPVHIREKRLADPVLHRITTRLEALAKAAVKSRGWPVSLTRSDEDVFIAVYPEGRGFYHRHRDVLPYFAAEIGGDDGTAE
eukprot:3332854-Prymnesium_polylepis.1